MRPRFLAAWLMLAAIVFGATTTSHNQGAPRPKLVVLLVVDQ